MSFLQSLGQNPETLPWFVLITVLVGGFFWLVAANVKRLTDEKVPLAMKRKICFGAGLLSLIAGGGGAGGGVGYVCQTATTYYALGTAGIGVGVATIIVGIILIAVACNWNFNNNEIPAPNNSNRPRY